MVEENNNNTKFVLIGIGIILAVVLIIGILFLYFTPKEQQTTIQKNTDIDSCGDLNSTSNESQEKIITTSIPEPKVAKCLSVVENNINLCSSEDYELKEEEKQECENFYNFNRAIIENKQEYCQKLSSQESIVQCNIMFDKVSCDEFIKSYSKDWQITMTPEQGETFCSARKNLNLDDCKKLPDNLKLHCQKDVYYYQAIENKDEQKAQQWFEIVKTFDTELADNYLLSIVKQDKEMCLK